MTRNIAEATEATLILCQVARQVVFHPDEPAFSTPVTTDGARCPALPAGAALAAHALTETAASDTATPAAAGSGKKIQTAHD